jgi:hypothetical protein
MLVPSERQINAYPEFGFTDNQAYKFIRVLLR